MTRAFSYRPARHGDTQSLSSNRIGICESVLARSRRRFEAWFGQSVPDRDVRRLGGIASVVRSRRAVARGRPRLGSSFCYPKETSRRCHALPGDENHTSLLPREPLARRGDHMFGGSIRPASISFGVGGDIRPASKRGSSAVPRRSGGSVETRMEGSRGRRCGQSPGLPPTSARGGHREPLP